ncbi:MAG: hypothetical protein Q9164_006753, partial [Protoblastenia rupestris]
SIRQGENVGNLAFSRVAPQQPLGINPYAYEQKTKPCAQLRDSPLFSGEVKAVEEGGEVALASGLIQQIFVRGDAVYRVDELDDRGRERYTKRWVCCVKFRQKDGTWWYSLKDGPPPSGRRIMWVTESVLDLYREQGKIANSEVTNTSA